MQETRLIMGMPVTVEVVDSHATPAALEAVFAYFTEVDERFSTYKENSEISRINAGLHPEEAWSHPMQEVMRLCQQTEQETRGYFNIRHNGLLDPSGLVKGWAIQNAATLLEEHGFQHFFVDAGGDIQAAGHNAEGQAWRVGIRNPFNREEIVKVIQLHNMAIATSGTYIRGQHVYNPHEPKHPLTEILSLSVIGRHIYDADRYATAAFAMGRNGLDFIHGLSGFEGFMIDASGLSSATPGFAKFVLSS